MKSLRSSADLARVLNEPLDTNLREVLTLRRDQWLEDEDLDLSDLVHVIIVEPGDTLSDVESEGGLSLLDPGFEFVALHEGYLEAVVVTSQDGFGVAYFVLDHEDVDPHLLSLFRAHA